MPHEEDNAKGDLPASDPSGPAQPRAPLSGSPPSGIPLNITSSAAQGGSPPAHRDPHRDPTQPIFVPPEGPPGDVRPDPTLYEAMGQDNIFRMLEDFYLELEKSEVRHLFPADMVAASKKSAAFFVGLMGGPPLFHQLYGPPMMRRRHIPFRIDEAARRVWLRCFMKTLENAEAKYRFPPQSMDSFVRFLEGFSRWMVNTA